jgi:hypothetical protein
MAAVLEEDYIFNWLAWDGDNMLASGAILDYGSIRQFAAKHDKYRFKDVDRYSASLREQRRWARLLVQVFAQAMAFIESGEKQNLRRFKEANCLRVFDQAFAAERDHRLLWRIGFPPEQIDHLMQSAQEEIKEFHRALSYFEDLKISKGIEKVPMASRINRSFSYAICCGYCPPTTSRRPSAKWTRKPPTCLTISFARSWRRLT